MQTASAAIVGANAEINRLQNLATGDVDEKIEKIEEYNLQIDGIYDKIQEYKNERFVFEQEILGFEREVAYQICCRSNLW